MKRAKNSIIILTIILISIGIVIAQGTNNTEKTTETNNEEETEKNETTKKESTEKETTTKEKNTEKETIYIPIEEIIENTNNTEKTVENKKENDTEKKEFIYINISEITKNDTEKTNNTEQEINVTEEEEEVEKRQGEAEPKENVEEDNSIEKTKESTDDSETKDDTDKKAVTEEELVTKKLVKDGRLEIEYKDIETSTIEIQKKEIIENKHEKRVQISSEEHFEREVRVYTDLPQEAYKEEIRLVWENKDEDVTKNKEANITYYDTNNNNKTDRIAFSAPHLSTQKYRILIIPKQKQGSNTTTHIGIKTISPGSGTVSNPVNFIFEFDYHNTSAIECTLNVGNESQTFNGDEAINKTQNFGVGTHNWNVTCKDETANKSNSTSGSFNVQDLFKLEMNSSTMIGSAIMGKAYANDGTVELTLRRQGAADVFLENLTGSYPEHFTIPQNKLPVAGTYTIIATSYFYEDPITKTANFSVSKANVTFPKTTNKGEETEFKVAIESPTSGTYTLYVGSSWLEKDKAFSGNTNKDIKTKLTNEGTLSVTLEVFINGKKYTFDYGNIEIKTEKDTEDPEVTLEFPEWEDTIQTKEITFQYRAYDDIKLDNCSLELFNATKSSNNVYTKDKLIFPLRAADKKLAFNDEPKNNSKIEVKLVDFDEGDYIWDVECHDNSSNDGSDFNYFSVDLDGKTNTKTDNKKNDTEGNNYTRSEEVKELIEAINSFLEKESRYNSKEREVLNVMGISDDMAFYKKRLVQIDQDFRFNLRFVTAEKKASREKEMYNEIDTIRKKIVTDIEVGSDYEYSKNSLDKPLEEIIKDYLALTGTDMKRSALNNLVNANEELQNSLTTRVASKKVTIEYLDETKEIVLVQKKLQLNEESIQTLFEVLPKDIRKNVIFLAGGKEIGEGIYEFQLEELQGEEIVYYFEEDFDLKKLEQTESVAFSEEITRPSSLITGMVSGIGDSINLYSFFFLFLIASTGVVGYFIIGKVRLEAWKKDNDTSMIIDLISQTKQHLRNNNIEHARTNYHQLKELYPKLPTKRKNFFYKEIKKVLLAINKKDIMNLLKEYEQAKNQNRKEDAQTLHKRISEIYKKLPKRYQEKVYQRLVKKEV